MVNGGMEKEQYIIKTVIYYMKENTKMENGMEKELNIIKTVI